MRPLCVLFIFLSVAQLFAAAQIQITYNGSFTAEQELAFNIAMGLWEPVLNSTVPIKINVRLANLPGYILVTLPNLIHNFPGAPQSNIWYPNALANALTGVELNPGEADCDFIVNPSPSGGWYYGTDLNCPAGQMDFISEMHKALPYALGYQSSFYVQSGNGTYGMLNPSVLGLTSTFPWEAMQSQPVLYDTFVCNTSGQFLTNTALFPNPSPALNAQLTGGNLRYQGTWGNAYAGNTQPVLYASTFNLARTARLNGSTYNGTENAPGCPTGDPGNVYRYPSPIVLGMLKDQGWSMDLSSLMPAPQVLFTLSENNLLLNWDEPDSPFTAHSYDITWNGSLYANSQESFLAIYNLSPGTHVFTVSARYSTGTSVPSDPVTIYVPTAADDESQLPGVRLSCSPNPFVADMNLDLDLERPAKAVLKIFDLKGRELGTIYNGNLSAGHHSLIWNGNGDDGKRLPTGLYFILLETGETRTIIRVCRIQ